MRTFPVCNCICGISVAVAGMIVGGCAIRSSFRTIAVPGTPVAAEASILYVSPGGNDAWSGRLPEANANGTDGPLATVAAARDGIRTIKAAGPLRSPQTVLLRGGMYPQPATLEFTPADSGTEECPVTYQACPGEYPIISGGLVLRGWEKDDSEQSRTCCQGKLWRLQVPLLPDGRKWSFNQLFVNGERRLRARSPNRGEFFRTDGPLSGNSSRGFYFREGDLRKWDGLHDVIAVVYHSWETSIHHLRSVDTESFRVTFREPAPWGMGRWEKQQRYYVENVFEGLDEPGEWYLNRQSGILYYYPMPGERMGRVEAVAPVLTSTLVRFKGDATASVEHIHFRGLSFQHSNADLNRIRNPGQGEIYQPGLIMATGLRNASFEACEMAHTGAHAIWLASGCEDIRVEQCHMHDLGGGGVYIGGGWGIHETEPVSRITVDNCYIHDGSYLFHGAHGVWIGKSSYNTITHNEISNLDYSGISCGWSWGFQPSSANHNILDYNHIHHLSNGEGLSDMGGIYTLGISPGTTERYNHIHDVYNYAHVSHGSGIYPDEGSSEILIENNVVYRVRTCPLFMHYGKDCLVRNNIFAFGGAGQMQRCREDKPCHYIAEGNILYADVQNMLGGVWKSGNWKVGRNVYWSTAGEPLFAGMDFETWKVKGNDAGSVVADPRFVDPKHGDFRLKPDSPALSLGFQPIDLSQTGLYGDSDWVKLPKHYPDRRLNEIPKPPVPHLIVNFDFDGEDAGGEPVDGKIVKGEKGASLTISDEVAVSGRQSLKFQDAAGQKNAWTPHIYYDVEYETGPVLLSWDMFNSSDAPADFYVEVREYEGSPYIVGPTVTVDAEGKVTGSGVPVGTIPLGEWAHVDIVFSVGEGVPKVYTMTLSGPGRTPVTLELPFASPRFTKVTWLGISSTSTKATTFYVDNLRMGTAEELAQPPKRRPRPQAGKEAPRKPANNEELMGYWRFNQGEGYVVEDSSGYANNGDLWASWAKGDFGTAIFCDPSATHMAVPDDPTLRFGTSDFSIELWICPTLLKIDSKDARRRFLSKDRYPNTWWNMNITSEGKPFLEMVDSNKITCSNKPNGVIAENVWTHLAVVVDRSHGMTRYYFNGRLDSSQEIPSAFAGSLDVTGGDLSIGSTWQPFVGLIDEVRIYRRALTENEIAKQYADQRDLYAGKGVVRIK